MAVVRAVNLDTELDVAGDLGPARGVAVELLANRGGGEAAAGCRRARPWSSTRTGVASSCRSPPKPLHCLRYSFGTVMAATCRWGCCNG